MCLRGVTMRVRSHGVRPRGLRGAGRWGKTSVEYGDRPPGIAFSMGGTVMVAKSFGALARLSLIVAALAVAGCASAPPEPGQLIADPYQNTNRDVHAFNNALDQGLIKPASEAYDAVTPALVKHLVRNEIQHLKLPGIFVNRILQGELTAASRAFGRFGVNTAMGAGGLLDPATELGLPYEPTDFGVTLAAWGADEGVYHEAPFFGPSTTRHVVGRVVNFALDPSILVTTGVVEIPTALAIADAARLPVDVVNTRHENAEIIDDILYQSEDSYVTARTAYVQNRRRLVAGETDTEQLPNIFD